MNSVQNGILPASLTRLDSANISSRNARPLKIRPRPNLRGIDGLARPILTQIQAMIGASVMIAMELTRLEPGGREDPAAEIAIDDLVGEEGEGAAGLLEEHPEQHVEGEDDQHRDDLVARHLAVADAFHQQHQRQADEHRQQDPLQRRRAQRSAGSRPAGSPRPADRHHQHATHALRVLAVGAPMPFSWLRPNQNHTRLTSMPMPEAMNTYL